MSIRHVQVRWCTLASKVPCWDLWKSLSMLLECLFEHHYRLMNGNEHMVDQTYLRACSPFHGSCIVVRSRCITPFALNEPQICKYAGNEVSIWMTVVHVELLSYCWSLAMPCGYQDECAILKSSFCTRSAHVYKNCAHSQGKSMQAVACPILVTLFVSRMP